MPAFPRLSQEKLQELVKLTGGLAVLVVFAVMLGLQGLQPSSLVGVAVCSGGSCTDTNGALSITSSPDSVAMGSASTISWSATGEVDTPNSLSCFGDANCGTQIQSISNLTDKGYFTNGAYTYMVSATGDGGSTGSKNNLYRWQPAGTPVSNTKGCWGNGTTCGSNSQSMTIDYAKKPTPFTLSGITYMVTGQLNGFSLYRFMPPGTPAGNTLGCFGNGTTCGTASQNISNGLGTPSNYQVYTIGANTYMTMGGTSWIANTFKWMPPPANSGKGCFGNGTACGVTGTINPYQTFANKVEHVSELNFNSQDYLVVSDNNNGAKLVVFKWTTTGSAPCTTGGGWGNGTACGTAVETIQPASAYAQITNPFYAKLFSTDTDLYMVVGFAYNASQTQLYKKIYKWMPTCNSGRGGFGNGTTCGSNNPLYTGSAHGDEPYVFKVGSQAYLAWILTLHAFMPGSNCYGSGTSCGAAWQTLPGTGNKDTSIFSVGGTAYLSSNSEIYKGLSDPCFGDSGGGCGVASQSISAADDSKDLEQFTVGAQTYVARADSGANSSPIYTWMSAQGCVGDGTTCATGGSDTSYQTITTNNIYDWDATAISGNSYLIASNRDATYGARVYKWAAAGTSGCPANGGFGNGSGCSTYYQSLSTGAAFQSDTATNATAGTLLAVGRDASTNSVYVYKWTTTGSAPCTTGGGYGDGTTCGAVFQSLSSDPSRSVEFFTVSSVLYLAVGRENDPNGMQIYQWTTAAGCPTGGSGFGNGTTCGTPLQTIAKKNIYDASFTTIGATTYALLRGVNDGVYVYQWRTSGTSCGTGAFGNATNCSGTPPTPLQTISLSNAYSLESFVVGATPYIAIGKNSGSQAMQIFSWMSGSNCFGNGSVCGTPEQTFPIVSGVNALRVIPGAVPYLLAGTTNGAYTYQWVTGSSYTPACSISWTDINGTDTFITGNGGSQTTGPLTVSTTYTLTCNGISGSVAVPVAVVAASASISSSVPAVALGGSALISWNSTGVQAGSCTINVTNPSSVQSLFSPGDSNAAAGFPSGKSTGALNQAGTYTYTLACNDSGGTPLAPQTVTIGVANITASPTTLTLPTNQSTLTWSSVNTSSCGVTRSPSGSIWSGTSGSQVDTYSSAGTYVYTLSCDAGVVTKTASVTVSAATTLPTIVSFLPAARVRAGNAAILQASVTGMSAGMTCSVSPAGSITSTNPQPWTSGSPWNITFTTSAITAPASFTLTCGSGANISTRSTTVLLLPSFQEI